MPVRRSLSLLVVVLPALAQTFTNPLFNSQDPWVTFDRGTYYFSSSCHRTAICVKASPTLIGLATAPDVEIWKAQPAGPNSADVWAPEIHKVDGHWYVYYCADNGNNDTHRLFALRALGDDPVGDYIMAETGAPLGQIVESSGHWAIDPDVFTGADGKLYLTWSCTGSPTSAFPQNICLARMKDPLHVDGGTIQISTPTEAWETRGSPIDEGPVGFVHNGKTFIAFSGSASFAANAYAVGLLTNAGGDLMRPASWVKTGPIFDRHSHAFGTGSVVFVQFPDGGGWWNLYHGIDRLDCNPNPYACRDIRMQPMSWNADGSPLLGYPYDPGVPVPLAPLASLEWGPAFGDMAEGNDRQGAVSGDWTAGEDGTIAINAAGDEVNRTFRRSNPNLPSFTVSVDVRWQSSGTSPQHRYGIYAAYVDAANFAAYAIDPSAKAIVSLVTSGGIPQPALSCPLADGFDPSAFHTIKAEKAVTALNVSVDGVAPKGPCNGRTVPFENGQTGLFAQDVQAAFRHFEITVGTH